MGSKQIQFSLSDVEQERWREWHTAHVKERHPNARDSFGPIGIATTFCFTSTGLGSHIKVVCSVCQEELDVTDYDSW